MAAGTKLVIQYETSDGGSVTHTWNYAKPGATKANVQALITATTSSTNRVIFQKVPIAVKSAKLVTTTESVYDLNELMQANGRDMRHLISTADDEDATTVDTTEVLRDNEEIERLRRRIAELEGK